MTEAEMHGLVNVIYRCLCEVTTDRALKSLQLLSWASNFILRLRYRVDWLTATGGCNLLLTSSLKMETLGCYETSVTRVTAHSSSGCRNVIQKLLPVLRKFVIAGPFPVHSFYFYSFYSAVVTWLSTRSQSTQLPKSVHILRTRKGHRHKKTKPRQTFTYRPRH